MKVLSLAYLTIREAVLKGTLLFYFAVSNAIILFFAIAVSGSTEGGKTIVTLFGNRMGPQDSPFDPVDFLITQLFNSSTSAIMLFGIFATAGLIPSMLEKGTVDLYLSKPISRTNIMLARCLGACGGIAVNLLYFALGIILVFGLKVGVWHWGFLFAMAISTIIFSFYYSIVAVTATVSRSTGFAIMLAFAFSLVSSALEMREVTLYPIWDNVVFHRVVDVLYYGTPQISAMISNASILIGDVVMRNVGMTPNVSEFSILPFLYSLLSASLLYGLTILHFRRQDY